LTDFIEHLLDLAIGSHTLTCPVNMVWRFKQERLHPALGKAAVEIKERAVLWAAGMAVAFGFATFKESLDQRGVQKVWSEVKGAQKMSLALAQGQSGGALERLYLTHLYM
jgi:hypothetical protein